MKMQRYFEALADAGKSLKIEKELIPALLTRALAYYQLMEFDMVSTACHRLIPTDRRRTVSSFMRVFLV